MVRTFHRKYPYSQTVRRANIRWAIVLCIFAFAAYLLTESILAFVPPLLIFIVQFFNIQKRHQYFVEQISIEDGNVQIQYSYLDMQYAVSGALEDFKMEKHIDWNTKFASSYLKISYRNQLVANQYPVGSWSFADIKQFDLNPVYIPGPDEVLGGKIKIKFLRKPSSDQ